MNTNTASIRQAFRQKRLSLCHEAQEKAGTLALDHFLQQPILLEAKRIAVYWAIRGELPTHGLINRILNSGNRVFLPRPSTQKPGNLVFIEYTHNEILTPDQFGIPTPDDTKDHHDLSTFDLMILPLVAADTNGNRIGMGKGFYDRTLSHLREKRHPELPQPLLVGWCYEWQVIPEPLTPAPWDVPLDALITDSQVRWFTTFGQRPKI